MVRRRRRKQTPLARMMATEVMPALTPRQAMVAHDVLIRVAADVSARVHDRVRAMSAAGAIREALWEAGWDYRYPSTRWERRADPVLWGDPKVLVDKSTPDEP